MNNKLALSLIIASTPARPNQKSRLRPSFADTVFINTFGAKGDAATDDTADQRT